MNCRNMPLLLVCLVEVAGSGAYREPTNLLLVLTMDLPHRRKVQELFKFADSEPPIRRKGFEVL